MQLLEKGEMPLPHGRHASAPYVRDVIAYKAKRDTSRRKTLDDLEPKARIRQRETTARSDMIFMLGQLDDSAGPDACVSVPMALCDLLPRLAEEPRGLSSAMERTNNQINDECPEDETASIPPKR